MLPRYYLKARLDISFYQLVLKIYCKDVVHHILEMLVSKPFYSKYVMHATPSIPSEIRENPKWYPFFEQCLRALDILGQHDSHSKQNIKHTLKFMRKGALSANMPMHRW